MGTQQSTPRVRELVRHVFSPLGKSVAALQPCCSLGCNLLPHHNKFGPPMQAKTGPQRLGELIGSNRVVVDHTLKQLIDGTTEDNGGLDA